MKNLFKKPLLNSINIEDRISKALKPLLSIIDELTATNEEITTKRMTNNDKIMSLGQEIDVLHEDNAKLYAVKQNNKKTIDKIKAIVNN